MLIAIICWYEVTEDYSFFFLNDAYCTHSMEQEVIPIKVQIKNNVITTTVMYNS